MPDLPVTRAVIELLGEVALLLWGVHMVHTGVLRAFGGDLRRVLAKALRHRFTALLAGLGVTLVLQSSTATALMTGSLGAAGVIALVPALAVMLGANVGTALVTCALAFDITLIFPLLLFAGLVVFRLAKGTGPRNIGRALIGLGLILLALRLLVDTFAPGAAAPEAREVVDLITREPLVVLSLATLLTWAMHSSIAAVLIIVTLAGAGVVTPVAALAMVLGANLGSAMNPLVNALSGELAARRLPLGNLVNRLTGCAIALPFLAEIADLLAVVAHSPGQVVVGFHLAFNVVLAALFIPALPWLDQLLQRALPDRARTNDPAQPRYLDRGSLATPAVALANAARETLRMADVVESMLAGSRELLGRDDLRLARELRRKDDAWPGTRPAHAG